MKRKLSILMIIALCFTMLPAWDIEAKTTISVTKSLELTVGQSKAIKVKGSYIKSKKYKTSSKKIATVSKKGKVTGKKSGKCKITVTIKYKKTKKAKKYLLRKFSCSVVVETQTPKKTEAPTQTPEATVVPTNTPMVVVRMN